VRTWLVVAAEAREFAGILKRFGRAVKIDWNGARFAREVEREGDRWLLVANGPGPRCVEEVFRQKMEVSGIINTGFCGALDPALRIGDIVVWGDAVWGDVPCASRFLKGEISSSDRVVVTAAEKRRLREKTGAIAAEMEAGAVKKVAENWQVPFHCVRAVSDTADEDMPLDFNLYRDRAGRFSLPKIALAAVSRPFTRIPALQRLEANCNLASESLGAFFADCRF
jgi:adenosylhomocysteine nucleosidase